MRFSSLPTRAPALALIVAALASHARSQESTSFHWHRPSDPTAWGDTLLIRGDCKSYRSGSTEVAQGTWRMSYGIQTAFDGAPSASFGQVRTHATRLRTDPYPARHFYSLNVDLGGKRVLTRLRSGADTLGGYDACLRLTRTEYSTYHGYRIQGQFSYCAGVSLDSIYFGRPHGVHHQMNRIRFWELGASTRKFSGSASAGLLRLTHTVDGRFPEWATPDAMYSTGFLVDPATAQRRGQAYCGGSLVERPMDLRDERRLYVGWMLLGRDVRTYRSAARRIYY